MDDRAELDQLRKMKRLNELEAKAVQPAPVDSPSQKTEPTLGSFLTGETSPKDYMTGIVDRVKSIPVTLKQSAEDLVKPPSISPERDRDKPLLTDEMKENLIGVATSVGPTSAFTKAARTRILAAKPADTVKQATMELAGKAGYSLPRSNIKESFWTNLGERFGGKQAIEATAQIKNQPITNKLTAKALGLADDTPITKEVLHDIRQNAGKAYEAVKNVGVLSSDDTYRAGLKEISSTLSGASKDFPELASKDVAKLVSALNKKTITSEGAVEMVKNLRSMANSNLGPLSGAQDKLLGRAQKKAADLLDDLIERNIEPKLGKEMLGKYRDARTLIAKSYTVEKALNPSTGNVSATAIGKASRKGAPLTNELAQIAEFSQAFPRITREPSGAPASGGLFEPMVYGTAGALATGGPGAAAAAIPIIGKPLARKLMTTVPKASKETALANALDNYLLQRGLLGTGMSMND